MRAFIALVALVGCGKVQQGAVDAPFGDDDIDAPMIDAPMIDAPRPTVQHLYVGDDGAPGGVVRYSLPLTAGQAADFRIGSANIFDVAFDPAGNMIVNENAGALTLFRAPLSGASMPAASFRDGNAMSGGGTVVTSQGQLIASGQTANINLFDPPFTNASLPSRTLTSGQVSNAIALALDNNENLYVANNTGGAGNVVVFPPPYTTLAATTPGIAGAAYRKLVIGGGKLFVAVVNPAPGHVDVYNLPIVAGEAPAFSITSGFNAPEAIALDADGHLYVGNLGDKTVVRFSPPYSAQSVPDVTLLTAATSIFGITIGP